jgi:hypothetical protein
VSAVESLFQNRECSERVQRKSRLSEKEQGEEIERRNREKKQREETERRNRESTGRFRHSGRCKEPVGSANQAGGSLKELRQA